MEAKLKKAEEVAAFLAGALPLANQEIGTQVWFALRLGPTTFAIFDAFPDQDARQAHLNGPIAAALMSKASELLTEPPSIEHADVLAAEVKSQG